ncbi:peptidase U32 family protein [Bacteroidota bacterium]
MKPELLAPAGDWKMLTAAVNAGADSVYFGIQDLNMRAKAKNFDTSEINDIVDFCKGKNVKTNLTINTIVFEDQLEGLDNIISAAKKADIDAIICWDMSVIEKCRKYEIPFCISTQASVSNSSAVKMYKKLGAKRIVLARECTLEKIKEIKKTSPDIEIEVFIHGAMCIAISGRCFMSHHIFNKSANTGECVQPCRREYEIYDKDSDAMMLLGEDYVLSPKDLCTIKFIDLLIDAKIDAFKIEGRKRSPEYISKVTSVYRSAIDNYFRGELSDDFKERMLQKLNTVYNRGFSSGFYFGEPSSADYADKYGSRATTIKVYVGKVINYFKKSKVVQVKIEASNLKLHDDIYIIGNKTGVVETSVESLLKDESVLEEAKQGDQVTFLCEKDIRPRDQVYKVIEVE